MLGLKVLLVSVILLISFIFHTEAQNATDNNATDKKIEQCFALLPEEAYMLSWNGSDNSIKILDNFGSPTAFQCEDLLNNRSRLTFDQQTACTFRAIDAGYNYSNSSKVDELGIVYLNDANSTTLLCENILPESAANRTK